jgi:hypothetical protein
MSKTSDGTLYSVNAATETAKPYLAWSIISRKMTTQIGSDYINSDVDVGSDWCLLSLTVAFAQPDMTVSMYKNLEVHGSENVPYQQLDGLDRVHLIGAMQIWELGVASPFALYTGYIWRVCES